MTAQHPYHDWRQDPVRLEEDPDTGHWAAWCTEDHCGWGTDPDWAGTSEAEGRAAADGHEREAGAPWRN